MPLLTDEEKRNTLGPIGQNCSRCGQTLVRHYCRQCDEFFITCCCKDAEEDKHAEHRVDRGDVEESKMDEKPESKIEAMQIALLADAERWAEAVEQDSRGGAREYMARIERAALAINKERTKIGAEGHGPGRLLVEGQKPGKLPLLVRLNMERQTKESAAVKEALRATPGGLRSCFRALKPPFTVLFEEHDGEWRGTLRAPGSKGGAEDIFVTSRARIPEYVWLNLCEHAGHIANEEEGPTWSRGSVIKFLRWIEENQKKYKGKTVAIKVTPDGVELIDEDENVDALEERMKKRPDYSEIAITVVDLEKALYG